MKKRAWVLFSVLVLTFSGIVARLARLTQSPAIQTATGGNTYSVTVNALRGTIYDRQLQPLVNSEKQYVAAVGPDEALLQRVRPAVNEDGWNTLLTRMKERRPAAVWLEEPIGITQGIRLFFTPRRYGEQMLAPHLIGYLDSVGSHGITGLERAYDNLLSQCSGEIQVSYAVSGNGACLSGVPSTVTDTTERSTGGIMLTIDKSIQQTVEELAVKYIPKGAVVIMEPQTGALLACASFPSFQPNSVAQSIAAADGALVNRALALYDCGSVFKTVTAAAALEHGVSLSRSFNCAGGMEVGSTTFHCHRRLGHQVLTFPQAYGQSCNLYFIQLANLLGGREVYNMAVACGFGEKLTLADGIEAPAAVLPTPKELQHPAALANFSFGQGKLLASPLHIARLTAAVVNDGLLPMPYLIAGTVDDRGKVTAEALPEPMRAFSVNTSRALRQMMELVVTQGTGQQAMLSSCQTAGKTGTAQTGQYNNDRPVVQSWFTGYFPADNPRYVITVLAEDADNTGGRATALFRALAEALTA